MNNYQFSTLAITGKREGDYFYALYADRDIISNIIEIKVRPHSLKTAFSYFFYGLALFAVLIFIIFRQHLKTRKEGNHASA